MTAEDKPWRRLRVLTEDQAAALRPWVGREVTRLGGIPIHESELVPFGEVLVLPGVMLMGTRPPTPLEQARMDGRRIVREGLADVIEWLRERGARP